MGLFGKLFSGGKKEPAGPAAGSPTGPAAEVPLSEPVGPPPPGHEQGVCGLQILFPRAPEWLPEDIAGMLERHHASFAGVEVVRQVPNRALPADAPPSQVFKISWNGHAADLAVVETAMPAPIIDTCLQGAFFSEDLKREASHHEGHAMLWYCGAHAEPLEQMVLLALAAGALAEAGGLAIVNENGCTATSVEMVRGPAGGDPLAHLTQMPIPMLYAGIKIFDIPHQAGAWTRTFGCGLLGLPDLALQILQPGAGEEHLMLVSRVLAELHAAKTPVNETVGLQLAPEFVIRFRAPQEDEFWLKNPPNALWVMELPGPIAVATGGDAPPAASTPSEADAPPTAPAPAPAPARAPTPPEPNP